MYRITILIAVISGFLGMLEMRQASAQGGVDSLIRGIGQRAVEEILRPKPPTTTPRTTDPTPQRHTAPVGPTQSEVFEVQQTLAALGYDPGAPDGLMGRNTASAIVAFQRDNGLRQTGAVNDTLLNRLRNAARVAGGDTAPQRVVRPSFDCTRAGTPTEYAICGNPGLAQLDRQMADAYAEARAQAANPSIVADAQRSWMSQRNACRSDVDCLRASMQERLATLQQTTRLAVSASSEFSDPEVSSPDPTDPSGVLTASNTTEEGEPVTEQGIGATTRDDGIRVHPSGRLIVPFPVTNRHSPEYRELRALTRHLRHAIVAERIGEMDPVEAPALFADIARDYLSPTDFQPFFCTPDEVISRASDCDRRSMSDYIAAGGQPDMAAEHDHLWWRGATEFERRRTMNAFAQSGLVDQVIASAPALPIRLLYAIEARLQPYDFETEHFPVDRVHGNVAGLELPNRWGGPFDLSGFVQPVAVPPAAAEALTRRLEAQEVDREDLILGIEMDVDLADPSDNRPLDAKIGAAEYFLNADATRPLATEIRAVTSEVATAAEPSPGAATTRTGGSLRPFDLQHEDDRIVMEFAKYDEPTDATREAIIYLFASAVGDVVEDFKGDLRDYVFPTLFSILHPDVRAHYFDCSVVKECRNRNTRSYFKGENEFEARQTRLAFEANVEPELAAEAPSFPIRMRMRLDARLSEYDFDKEGFELAVFQNARLRLDSVRHTVNLQNVFDLVPSFVPMPPKTAERLVSSGRNPVLSIDYDVLSFVTNGLETITKVRPVAVVLMEGGAGGEIYFEQVFDTPDVTDTRRDAAQALLGPPLAGAVASSAPTDYPVMGVAPGMTLDAAVNALSQSFSDAQITVDEDMLRAERGYCGYYLLGNDVAEDDMGAICFAASHRDQRISRVVLQRFVHRGDISGLTEQTRASFGDPASRGEGNVPAGAILREILGWGEKIEVARATIGRPEIRMPPREAELDIIYMNSMVAVFTLRVDVPPASGTPHAEHARSSPELEPEPQSEATATGTDASELTVVGIKLGMPLEKAITNVQDVAETIYRAQVTPSDPEVVEDRYTFLALDNGETFALHTAKVSGSPVIGVARRIPVGDNVPVEAILGAFIDAYGTPTFTEENGSGASWRWELEPNRSAEDVACISHFSTAMGSGQMKTIDEQIKNADAISRTFDGASMWANNDNDGSFFRYYMNDRAPRVGILRREQLRDCAPFLQADFVVSQTHPNHIRVYLVDAPAFEAEIKAAEEEAAKAVEEFNSKL